jgi:hypothetical protein
MFGLNVQKDHLNYNINNNILLLQLVHLTYIFRKYLSLVDSVTSLKRSSSTRIDHLHVRYQAQSSCVITNHLHRIFTCKISFVASCRLVYALIRL